MIFFYLVICTFTFYIQAQDPYHRHENGLDNTNNNSVLFFDISLSCYENLLIIKSLANDTIAHENLTTLCDLFEQGQTTMPLQLVEKSLEEAAACLMVAKHLPNTTIEHLAINIEAYCKQLEEGTVNLVTHKQSSSSAPSSDATSAFTEDEVEGLTRDFKNKLFNGNLTIAGDETIKGDLNIYGNEKIYGNETVLGNVLIGGNETINGNLTVNGQINGQATSSIPCNLVLPSAAAGTSTAAGCTFIELGGANPSTSNISIFEATGTSVGRNLFAGNYTTVPAITTAFDNTAIGTNALASITTGTSNIAIGSNANVNLTNVNNAIALGTATTASVQNAIAIGRSAFAGGGITQGGIAIGSSNDSSPGPIATGDASIAIGSAQACSTGALATNQNAVAIGVNAQATGGYSLAFGWDTTASGLQSIAIGSVCTASGSTATVIGEYATATASTAITVGFAASSSGVAAISIGTGPQSNSANAIAIGSQTTGKTGGPIASQQSAIAIGSAGTVSFTAGPIASQQSAIAIGSGGSNNPSNGPVASGISAIALGSGGNVTGLNGSTASGDFSIAIGTTASSGATNAIAIGTGSNSSFANAICIGSQTTLQTGGPSVTASRGIAIGSAGTTGFTSGALASAQSGIAIGSGGTVNPSSGPVASGISAIALGSGGNVAGLNGSTASGDFSIAIGTTASSGATNAIAIGTGSNSSFANAICIGSQTALQTGGPSVTAPRGIAIGSAGTTGFTSGALASAQNGIAIGSGGTVNPSLGPIASATSAIALGSADVGSAIAGASASGVRSIAIGTGASVSQNDAILLGNATSAVVKVGIGTNTPVAKLHVANTGAASGVRVDGTASQWGFDIPGSTGNGVRSLPTFGRTTTTNTGVAVLVDNTGDFGTISSSRRFKKNFRNLDGYSSKLYDLNPVLFDYNELHGGWKNQFGLVAEEVEQHLPEIVVHDKGGNIYSVQYHNLIPLLLNETQHHQQKLESQNCTINALLQDVEQLKAALEVLKAQ